MARAPITSAAARARFPASTSRSESKPLPCQVASTANCPSKMTGIGLVTLLPTRDDIRCLQQVTIVERHALSDGERITQPVLAARDAFGQHRCGVEVAVESEEPFVDMCCHIADRVGRGDMQIERRRLGFHGEASMRAWEYEICLESAAMLEVKLSTQLLRSPYKIERWLALRAGSPVLYIRERITNQAGEPMDCMWSHHPAFGAPFLSEHCVIDTGARTLLADDEYAGAANPLSPGATYDWRKADELGMSRVPSPDQPRDLLAYLRDFESGWYAITNQQLGMGIGMCWDAGVFPYAWFWQEINSSPGFPFYKRCYVIAIEPASSIPGQGLSAVIEKTGAHLTLQPGESREVELKAVFYAAQTGVAGISDNGMVRLK